MLSWICGLTLTFSAPAAARTSFLRSKKTVKVSSKANSRGSGTQAGALKSENSKNGAVGSEDETSKAPVSSTCERLDQSDESLLVEDFCLRINEIRKSHGLPLLTIKVDISDVAQDHAEDMYENDYFSHTNLDGESSFDRLKNDAVKFQSAAENIAWGQKTSAKVLTAWMNSPGHRKNMLNPKYKKFGIGMVNYYWVLNLTN